MGPKRNVAQVASATAMLPKKAKIESPLEMVIKSIGEVADQRGASAGERSVILEMARGGLGTPEDERHAFQIFAVDNVSRYLQSTQQFLQHSLEEAQAAADGCNEAYKRFAAERARKVTELEEGRLAARSAKLILAEAATAVKAASQRKYEAMADRLRGDADHSASVVDKQRYETFLSGQFRPLRDRTHDHEGSEAIDLKDVVTFAEEFDLGVSFVTSLERVLRKLPETRRGFDLLTLEQFEKSILEKIGEIACKLDSLAPEVAARKAAADAADEHLTKSKKELVEAAALYRKAVAVHEDADATVHADLERATEQQRGMAQAIEKVTTWKAKLSCFETGLLASFLSLRSRRSEKETLHMPSTPAKEMPDVAVAVGMANMLAVGGQ